MNERDIISYRLVVLFNLGVVWPFITVKLKIKYGWVTGERYTILYSSATPTIKTESELYSNMLYPQCITEKYCHAFLIGVHSTPVRK